MRSSLTTQGTARPTSAGGSRKVEVVSRGTPCDVGRLVSIDEEDVPRKAEIASRAREDDDRAGSGIRLAEGLRGPEMDDRR
jgi:hypothetical protein